MNVRSDLCVSQIAPSSSSSADVSSGGLELPPGSAVRTVWIKASAKLTNVKVTRGSMWVRADRMKLRGCTVGRCSKFILRERTGVFFVGGSAVGKCSRVIICEVTVPTTGRKLPAQPQAAGCLSKPDSGASLCRYKASNRTDKRRRLDLTTYQPVRMFMFSWRMKKTLYHRV